LLAREADKAGEPQRAAKLRQRQARVSRNRQVACNIRMWTPAEQEADPKAAATVASYIYGYAMKSTTGSLDDKGEAARNAVWAGTRRIRRWAIIGLRRGLLGEWQDIYRTRERPDCAVLGPVWDAMQARNWLHAFELLDATGEGDQPPVVRDRDWRINGRGQRTSFPVALRANTNDLTALCERNVIMLYDPAQSFVRTPRRFWEAELAILKEAGEIGRVDELAVSESFPRPSACGAGLGAMRPSGGGTAPPTPLTGGRRGGMAGYIGDYEDAA
jgi:hypothetical protein